MKRWQLEGMCYRFSPKKLVLPDPSQAETSYPVSLSKFSQESRVISCCRKVVAFFIRFF